MRTVVKADTGWFVALYDPATHSFFMEPIICFEIKSSDGFRDVIPITIDGSEYDKPEVNLRCVQRPDGSFCDYPGYWTIKLMSASKREALDIMRDFYAEYQSKMTKNLKVVPES
jgi:hypothetical protein